jgi:hypothetical protein
MSAIARCYCHRPHRPQTNHRPSSSGGSGWDKIQNDAKNAGAELDGLLDKAMKLAKSDKQADQQQAQILMARYSARSQGLSNIFKTLSDALQAVVRNFR